MKLGTESKLKFKCLQRKLGLSFYSTIGLLEALWLATYSNAPAGDIGKLSNEEIAAAIEWDGDPDELITALVEYCWLDADDEFRLIVHDWSEHCAQFLKGAFAKHGKTFADTSAKQRAKHCARQPAKHGAKDDANSNVPGTMPPIQFNSSLSNSSQANSISSTEAGEPPSVQPAIVFNTVGQKNRWSLPQDLADTLAEAFPDLDILAECRKAQAWCYTNRVKRKTPSGMPKFLNGWMSKAQNSGRAGPSGPTRQGLATLTVDDIG